MTTESKTAALVEQIFEAEKTAEKDRNKKIGPLIRDLRTHLRLSPAEFAARLGISVPTVSRWENKAKEAPPHSRLAKLRDLLKPGPPSAEAPRDYVVIGDTPVCIRPLTFILAREKEAKEVWLTKHLKDFLSGDPGEARETMRKLLLSSPELHFKFLFFGPQDEAFKKQLADKTTVSIEKLAPYPALVSFARFKGSLLEMKDALSKRVHGWIVSEADAFQIGLSAHSVGTAVMVYDSAKAGTPARKVDVFIEFPLAVCDPSNPVTLVDAPPRLYWAQLPARDADHLWLRWNKALARIAKAENEFCMTAEEFQILTLP